MAGRADLARQRMLAALAAQPLFEGLAPAALAALAELMEWFQLPAGSVLFDQDEASDGLFLLAHGRLAATRREDGRVRDLGIVGPGECVGETGLLADEPRAARVVAVRDSELLFLPRSGFERLAAAHPEATLKVVQLVVRRLHGSRGRRPQANCHAVLPGLSGVDAHAFAHRFARELGGGEQIALIDAALAAGKPTAWFSEREASRQHLVYVGNEDPGWRERCMRQSDCVLVVVDATRTAQIADRLPLPERLAHVPVHLVLLQNGTPRAGSTREWRAALPRVHAVHHVCRDDDVGRLARRLTGRATGLVLSGGGARGFAHLGAIRALLEAGYRFDHVGGTSIGAIVGAGLAADWSLERMHAVFREQFVTSNPLADWTLPVVSLRSGANVSRRLRGAFDGQLIEDLPVPFFCVSSNLSDGALEVHETGELWRWLRASCAIPGILPPVFSRGRVLVDGGVIDNLPVGEMRRRLTGDIVAIDVGGNYRLAATTEETELPAWWHLVPQVFGRRERPSIGQILLRSGMVNSLATVTRRRKQTRLLICPPLTGIELLDWKAFDRAIAAGYEYTARLLAEQRSASM